MCCRLRATYSAEQDSILRRVVRHAEHWELRPTGTRYNSLKTLVQIFQNEKTNELLVTATIKNLPAQLHDSSVFAAVEVQLTEETILNVVQHVSMYSICWSLTLQLEHNHAAIMT